MFYSSLFVYLVYVYMFICYIVDILIYSYTHMFRYLLLVMLVFVLILPRNSSAQLCSDGRDYYETILYPLEDARTRQFEPDRNYGSATTLVTRGTDAVAFLRFDYTPVVEEPLFAHLIRNDLFLYITDSTVDGPEVMATTGDWSESTLTWNTMPSYFSTDGFQVDASQIGWTQTHIYDGLPGNPSSHTVVLSNTHPDDYMEFSSREGTYSPYVVAGWCGLLSGEITPTPTVDSTVTPTIGMTVTPTFTGTQTLVTPTLTPTSVPESDEPTEFERQYFQWLVFVGIVLIGLSILQFLRIRQ